MKKYLKKKYTLASGLLKNTINWSTRFIIFNYYKIELTLNEEYSRKNQLEVVPRTKQRWFHSHRTDNLSKIILHLSTIIDVYRTR